MEHAAGGAAAQPKQYYTEFDQIERIFQADGVEASNGTPEREVLQVTRVPLDDVIPTVRVKDDSWDDPGPSPLVTEPDPEMRFQQQAMDPAVNQQQEPAPTPGQQVEPSMSLTSMPERLPEVLAGGYDLVGPGFLGEGAFALVKLLQSRSTQQLVALKIMEKYPLAIRHMLPQAERELRIQKSLAHPNIVSVLDVFDDETHLYMLLEYCDGGCLPDLVAGYPNRRLPESAAGWYFGQLLQGVGALHASQAVHRDLKPENLLLTRDEAGRPQSILKIADFGWCADLVTQEYRTTVCGTLHYMAPEILLNEPHRYPVDVWCLGILLYELLAGHPPFWDMRDQREFVRKVCSLEFGFPPWLSQDVCHLIQCCLQRFPQDRWTCDQLLAHPWVVQHAVHPALVAGVPDMLPEGPDPAAL
mmetsp:Transcript_103310/g.236689  ORF Transcript_103310/g.236689 Transcript_103310/m.236689 type:complete len:415 (+) Transcript_103310:103-1347(+)